MAEDGGLFSGLKFTDIFFPAAGAVASMYNPHIGRGLQTGMNMFNSFQDFQNSARYYKQLKEDNERQQAGIEEAKAGIGVSISDIQGDIAGLPGLQRDMRDEGPLLDESQTSKYSLFGDEGPELADPGNFSLHMKELEDIKQQAALTGGPSGQALGLGVDEITNPRFSEIDMDAIVANDEVSGQQEALEMLLRQEEKMLSFMQAAPGVATQGSSLAGYVPLDAAFRDEARRKDLLAAFEQQDRSAELAEIERQAQQRQVQATTDIYSAENQRQERVARQYAEDFSMPKDPSAPLSYTQQRQLGSAIYSAYQDSKNFGIEENARTAGAQRALSLALEAKNRGLPVPEYMLEAVAQYELATTGQVYPADNPANTEKKDTGVVVSPAAVQTANRIFGIE